MAAPERLSASAWPKFGVRVFLNAVNMYCLKNLQSDASGAVTVDWVVRTGAVMGIAFGLVATIFGFLGAAEAAVGRELEKACAKPEARIWSDFRNNLGRSTISGLYCSRCGACMDPGRTVGMA